jgi:hypothetical protein
LNCGGFYGIMRRMPPARRFPARVIAAIRNGKYFGIRAGRAPHRFIGIWMVEVGGRVFVRSWTMKRDGWYRTLLAEKHGAIQAGPREVRVRARRVTSERVKDAVSAAYFAKYDTPASLKYCRGFARGRRRETTTELVPF